MEIPCNTPLMWIKDTRIEASSSSEAAAASEPNSQEAFREILCVIKTTLLILSFHLVSFLMMGSHFSSRALLPACVSVARSEPELYGIEILLIPLGRRKKGFTYVNERTWGDVCFLLRWFGSPGRSDVFSMQKLEGICLSIGNLIILWNLFRFRLSDIFGLCISGLWPIRVANCRLFVGNQF